MRNNYIDPAILREYEKSFDKAVALWANHKLGSGHSKKLATVANKKAIRFCKLCKKTFLVKKGERIREDCIYCQSIQLDWVDEKGQPTDAPPLSVAAFQPTGSYMDTYTSVDFSIDFERWLRQQPYRAFVIMYLYHVYNLTTRDIAKEIHSSQPWVVKVISKTRKYYEGAKCPYYRDTYRESPKLEQAKMLFFINNPQFIPDEYRSIITNTENLITKFSFS